MVKTVPRISVVMSVFNAETFLHESILSVLQQTFTNFEFLIIDDGSTDASLEIIQEYKRHDSRVILIKNENNLGLARSLNFGLKKAKGEYIARMDADDVSLPNRLQIQSDFLDENEDIFLVGSNCTFIDQNGKELYSSKVITNQKQLKKKLLSQNPIMHPTILFRNTKSFFYREKMYFVEDYDFYLCLLTSQKKMINIPDILLQYRISQNSISRTKAGLQVLFSKKAREFYKQRSSHKNDQYKYFQAHNILNVDTLESKDPAVLKAEIWAAWNRQDFILMRKLIKRYLSNRNYSFKFFACYMISFLPNQFIQISRKIKKII